MALRFLDGCNHYNTAQISRKWSVVASNAATITISAGTGRNGVNSLRAACTNASGVFGQWALTLDAQSRWILGFAVKLSALPVAAAAFPLVQIMDGVSVQVDLRVSNTGVLTVTRNGTALTGGTSLISLSAGTWYYLEVDCTISASISAGQFQVYVDGVSRISVAAGQNTKATSNATADTIRVGFTSVGITSPAAAITLDTCDYYVLDGTAGQNTPYGDTKVVTLLPTAQGAENTWTPDSGVASGNWSRVNAGVSADGASGYVQTGVIGNRDTYGMADVSGTPTIRSLQVTITAEETDVGTRTLGASVRPLAIAYDSAGQQLTGGYAMYRYEYETDPGTGVAWLYGHVNSLEVGPVLVS